MRVNLVPESARHLEMTRARQMRVDTRDLAEANITTQRHYDRTLLIRPLNYWKARGFNQQ